MFQAKEWPRQIRDVARTLLALLALVALAGPAYADLLWEITHRGSLQDAGQIQPALLWFFAVTPPEPLPFEPSNPNLPFIGGIYPNGSEGLLVHIAPEKIDGMRAALTSANGSFVSEVFGQGGQAGGTVDSLWTTPVHPTLDSWLMCLALVPASLVTLLRI